MKEKDKGQKHHDSQVHKCTVYPFDPYKRKQMTSSTIRHQTPHHQLQYCRVILETPSIGTSHSLYRIDSDFDSLVNDLESYLKHYNKLFTFLLTFCSCARTLTSRRTLSRTTFCPSVLYFYFTFLTLCIVSLYINIQFIGKRIINRVRFNTCS